MTAILGIVAVLAVMAAIVFFLRASSSDGARDTAAARVQELEQRLTTAQEDLNGAKEDLKRRTAALEDARERAAKAKKKEIKDAQKPAAVPNGSPDPVVMARYASAVESAERRAKEAEQNLETKLEEARAQARRDVEAQVEELKRKLAKATEKKEEKPVEPRAPERPFVPGARIDLAKLDVAVVDELRRFHKRAVNTEKLLALADQKLELVVDKLEETQRRYYAVCRELSLAAVNSKKPQELSDAEAAKLAQDLVAASEDATHRRSNLQGTPRRKPEARRDAPAGEGAARDGEGRGGNRRRRMFGRRDRAENTVDGQKTEGATPAGGAPKTEGAVKTDAAPAAPKAETAPAPAVSTPSTQG